jgi:hypothetical protein
VTPPPEPTNPKKLEEKYRDHVEKKFDMQIVNRNVVNVLWYGKLKYIIRFDHEKGVMKTEEV